MDPSEIPFDMDPSKLLFDIEAYKRQSEIEERYILNQFRERQKKIDEGYPPRSKRRYHKGDHAAANQRLIADYLFNQPTYDDAMFRRRFWMRKHIFLQIVGDLSRSDDYFTKRFDAANKEGISPLAKCTTVKQMLAYGMEADAVDEYIKIGGTTALECLCRFSKGIIQLYEQVYLRTPTEDELQRILDVSDIRGFLGMIGSTLNDINVLDRSPVFDDVEQGNISRVNFFMNQRPYNMDPADGIYHSYAIFVKSIRLHQSEPDKLFAQVQEGCRKDIEHVFGVLQARLKSLVSQLACGNFFDLTIIMRSCIILHNMIVEDEQDTFARLWTDYDQSEASKIYAPQPFPTEVLHVFVNHVCARSELRDSNVHHESQAYLEKHIWRKFKIFRG